MVSNKSTGLVDPAGPYIKTLDAPRIFDDAMGDVDGNAPTRCSEANALELLHHVLYGTVWIEDVIEGKTM